MTELSFLIDLLLNHRLQKSTRDLIAARLKEVESSIPLQTWAQKPQQMAALSPHVAQQAPSMQAIMARHPDLVAPMPGQLPHVHTTATADTTPVAVVAQTPATQAAMASRQQAIAESIAGKVDKEAGRPRKF